jgi:hypothetical protein
LLQEVPDMMAKHAHALGDRVHLELQTRGIKQPESLEESSTAALPDKADEPDE